MPPAGLAELPLEYVLVAPGSFAEHVMHDGDHASWRVERGNHEQRRAVRSRKKGRRR